MENTVASFLTNEEIVQIFDSFQQNTNKNSSQENALVQRPVGELIWVKNEGYDENDQDNSTKPFYKANVIKDNGATIYCNLAQNEECNENQFKKSFDTKSDLVMEYSLVAEKGIADMIDIDELNHATILYNLYKRYLLDEIYTYVGPTLLAVNPFKNMSHKYPDSMIEDYRQICSSDNYFEIMKNLPPHTFAIAAYSHKQMTLTKTRQAIVISGESGAGKTEAAKLCMRFLTSLGSKNIDPNKAPMETRILKTNPVLEAFGNSRTARNDNSSRFGKYVKLYFDKMDGKVLGAEIKNYLLEKSRVVGASDLERNYHVFFFMLRGVNDERAKKLGFMKSDGKTRKEKEDFNYLIKCRDKPVQNDIQDYNELESAFKDLGFSEEEIDAIHRVTAAAIHIGQIELDESTYVETKSPVSIKNIEQVQLVADLLGIQDVQLLIEEIVNKEKSNDPSIKSRTPDKPIQVQSTLESLAKSMFDNLFNWLVLKMNIEILPEDKKSGDILQFNEKTKTIGLLDIFGFENFDKSPNQFEQLCINYVNEKLHNLYISSVFGSEKKEMEREGIDVDLVLPAMKVLDVLKILDNVTAPQGIFKQIDDKSKTNLKNDTMSKRTSELYNLIIKTHDANKKIFTKIKDKDREKFTISHSAKDVKYDTFNFIESNSDSLSASLSNCLNQKASPKIIQIYTMQTDNVDEVKKVDASLKTIWSKFTIQIQDLMLELAEPLIPKDFNSKPAEVAKVPAKTKQNEPICEKCDLHFVRCLKPNDKKVGNLYVHAMTLQQITYMGVLESIKVKQENFPYRKNFQDFYKIYEILSPYFTEQKYDQMTEKQKEDKEWFKNAIIQIFEKVFAPIDKSQYQKYYAIGRTKVLKMPQVRVVLQESKKKASQKYDLYTQFIKRSSVLGKQNYQLLIKKFMIIKIQRFMKKAYKKIQMAKAQVVDKQLRSAIIKFKTEKRKAFETEAAEIIEDSYRKYIFRKQLKQALDSREYFMKELFNLATIKRFRKMWICRRMTMQMVDRAFYISKKKKEQDSVFQIQRIIRGNMERKGKEELIKRALKMKVELKQHVSAKKVQKKLKGLIVRRRIEYMSQKVSYIQSVQKMIWTKRIYSVIKKNVIIVQKAYRRYMARRDQIKYRLYYFLASELQVVENVRAMEYTVLNDGNVNRNMAQQQGLIKTLTPYSQKKINFFTRVIDLNILIDLSEIYSQAWSRQWIQFSSQNTLNDNPILSLQIGQTHSMAVNSKGNVFVWGWNDNGQCAKSFNVNEVLLINESSFQSAKVNFNHLKKKEREKQYMTEEEKKKDKQIKSLSIKQSLAVEDRCLLLLQDTNEIICWGSNTKGQLGLGHYEDVFIPQKVDYFQRTGNKVSFIAAGGDLNFACTDQGQAYAWPFNKNGIKQSIPTRMPFSDKTFIHKVSCGHNFGFFISNQGLVYAFGEDNSDGQLGLGHIYPNEYPELIQCFKDIGERIDTIECGFKHSIAKSSLGKLYTWGSSNKGQLGHDHFGIELSPRALQLDRKNNKKVSQIAAGYSHSLVMMEQNKEVYWFGTCGGLKNQARPLQFDFQKYLPDLFQPTNVYDQFQSNSDDFENFSPFVLGSQQQDFAIVKINSSWSKTMTVSNMIIADLRAVNQDQTYSKLNSTMQNLCSKWDPRDVMPPYIDCIAGLFPANIMRKQNLNQNGGTNNQKYSNTFALGKNSTHNIQFSQRKQL